MAEATTDCAPCAHAAEHGWWGPDMPAGKTHQAAVEVPLTRGYVALVDQSDYEIVAGRKWHVVLKGKAGSLPYAYTWESRSCRPQMHRLLLSVTDPSVQVDHVNRDTLDNRRSNLRISTHAQNTQNTKRPSDNRSGFKGVCYHRARTSPRRWVAYISTNGRRTHLGYFLTPEEAAVARDAAALQQHGEFAVLNFPERAA